MSFLRHAALRNLSPRNTLQCIATASPQGLASPSRADGFGMPCASNAAAQRAAAHRTATHRSATFFCAFQHTAAPHRAAAQHYVPQRGAPHRNATFSLVPFSTPTPLVAPHRDATPLGAALRTAMQRFFCAFQHAPQHRAQPCRFPLLASAQLNTPQGT